MRERASNTVGWALEGPGPNNSRSGVAIGPRERRWRSLTGIGEAVGAKSGDGQAIEGSLSSRRLGGRGLTARGGMNRRGNRMEPNQALETMQASLRGDLVWAEGRRQPGPGPRERAFDQGMALFPGDWTLPREPERTREQPLRPGSNLQRARTLVSARPRQRCSKGARTMPTGPIPASMSCSQTTSAIRAMLRTVGPVGTPRLL